MNVKTFVALVFEWFCCPPVLLASLSPASIRFCTMDAAHKLDLAAEADAASSEAAPDIVKGEATTPVVQVAAVENVVDDDAALVAGRVLP